MTSGPWPGPRGLPAEMASLKCTVLDQSHHPSTLPKVPWAHRSISPLTGPARHHGPPLSSPHWRQVPLVRLLHPSQMRSYLSHPNRGPDGSLLPELPGALLGPAVPPPLRSQVKMQIPRTTRAMGSGT